MNPDLPSGTVTFLFTDIEASTRLWQEKPQAMAAAHARHDAILQDAIESNHGYIFRTVGDSFHVAFRNALDGLLAALSAQRGLQAGQWEGTGALRVRMGLHTGAAEISSDGSNQYREGYATIATAQRVMSVAHGGQVLLSQTTHDLSINGLPEQVSLRDMGEHSLKGLRLPLRLYQLVAPGLQQEFPPIQSLNNLPNNLPLQLTSFIGRGKEMADITSLLDSARLVTLTGSGGTGKTRLSVEVGTQELGNFQHGVWFIELETLTDPAQIIPAMAQVLGLQEQPFSPLASLVVDYLREKQTLLILDNCEHLVDACARLANDLLHQCARLKIIASSREALEIAGEIVYAVPPLAESESTQLFVERARLANPNFNLTKANTAPIARICSRLDGIPLAIELAAARVKVLSPEQIAARLDDRFRLLVSGSRTALPRQQTLRALIDWSYDLLSEEERLLFRRLSVFAGGWTLEAAEAICPDLDVLDLLDQLINKSLVIAMQRKTATRYRLLETIRQYGRDKLIGAGELEAAADKHAGYFLQLAIDSEPKLNAAGALRWVELLEAERENLRATMEWFLERNVESALKIIAALGVFWSGHGHPVEGRHWAEAAIARAEALPPVEGEAALQRKKLEANAMISFITLLVYLGDNAYAEVVAKKCAALARQIGDKKLLAQALTFTCMGRLVIGDTRGVEAMMSEALSAARQSEDNFTLGMALGTTALLLMNLGKDPEIMQAYSKEGIALLQNAGNLWGLSLLSTGMGLAAKFKGHFDEARARFAAVEPVLHEIGDEHRLNLVQSELAHLDRYEGHFEKARQKYLKTIVKWQKLGHRAAVAHQLESLAFIAIAQGQLERAARLLGAAEALREKINIQMSPAEQVEYGAQVAKLRLALDASRCTSLWNEGSKMTMDQAIQFAVKPESIQL